MGKNSAKSICKELYYNNPKITEEELFMIVGDQVTEKTIRKYLIEFKNYRRFTEDSPEEISMSKLESELAHMLQVSPNSTVVKSCIDFLRLKQSVDDKTEELDMEKFIKKGKDLLKLNE